MRTLRTLSFMHHYGLNAITFAANSASWSYWATHRSSLTSWSPEPAMLERLKSAGQGIFAWLATRCVAKHRMRLYIYLITLIYQRLMRLHCCLSATSHVCWHYFLKCGPYQSLVGTRQGQMWPACAKMSQMSHAPGTFRKHTRLSSWY